MRMILFCLLPHVKTCENFANSFKLIFNPDKCSLLIYADKNAEFYYNNCMISLCGKIIKNVKTEKHLGHTFTCDNNLHLINIDSIIRDLKVRTNTIINQFKSISWQAKVKVFLSQCSSLYGCQLWRLDDKQIAELVTAWNICCRRLLALPPDTRTYVIPNIMGTLPIRFTIMYRMLNFFISGLNHSSKMIASFFKNALLSNTSYMLQNVNIILREFEIKYCDMFDMNKFKLKKVVESKLDLPDWRSNIIIELLSLRDNQFSCEFYRNEQLLYALEPLEVSSLLKYVSAAR